MTLLCCLLFAQAPTVTLVEKDLPVTEALASLLKQTGVRATLDPARPVANITLDLRGKTPWEALDAIATRLDSRLELRDRTSVRLVRKRPGEKPVPTHYDGPFRVRVARVQATGDFTTDADACTVTLEVGWLPTLRPLFLDSAPHDLQLVGPLGKRLPIEESAASLVPVDAPPSTTLDVVLPAFPRSATHIPKFAGKLNAIVLGEMLAFDFDANLDVLYGALPDGAQRRLTRKGIMCSIVGVSAGRDRWTVRMALDYPAGANRSFESFQAGTMVLANELRLVSLDGKRTLAPAASIAEETGPRRTVVSFHFTDGPTGKRGSPGAWRVRYRAPAQVIDRPLSFSFDKVPLP